MLRKTISIFIAIIVGSLLTYTVANLYLKHGTKAGRTEQRRKTWDARMAEYSLNSGQGKVMIDTELKIPKTEVEDWSYPWYMVKTGNGQFENTLGDPITEKDTTKLIHNAKCKIFITEDDRHTEESHSKLPFAEAKLRRDTLKLKIYNESASNWDKLSFRISKDKFWTDYEPAYTFPYQKIECEFLNLSLILNRKPPFQKGQILKGRCAVQLKETLTKAGSLKSSPITKLIQGTFKVEIK